MYSVRTAKGPYGSNVNNPDAVRGRQMADYGMAKIQNVWNDPWFIWFPNHGSNPVIKPA